MEVRCFKKISTPLNQDGSYSENPTSRSRSSPRIPRRSLVDLAIHVPDQSHQGPSIKRIARGRCCRLACGPDGAVLGDDRVFHVVIPETEIDEFSEKRGKDDFPLSEDTTDVAEQ